jgi:hypothetical protein
VVEGSSHDRPLARAIGALGARDEPRAVALSLLFVAVGIGVLWFAKDVAELDEDAVLVSLLLLPVLLYLALSGRLAEVTGPGGVGAKFREVANAPAHSALKHLSPEDPFLVPKMDLQMLRQQQPQLAADDRPIVFTFTLGAGAPQYGYPDVTGYTDVLAATGRFLLVAFLDPGGRVLAYMSARRFQTLVRSEAGQQFVADLNAPDAHQRLLVTPGVATDTLRAGASNAEALQVMTDKDLEAVVLVDDSARLSGVVERERVVADMLLAATP